MSAERGPRFPCGICRDTADAAETGHLTCLEWAVEHNVPWHPDTTWCAADADYLACLQFAHEHGCPWDPNTTCTAAYGETISCLQYIFEHCGDVASWEDSGLQQFEEMNLSEYIKAYLRNVQEHWKAGANVKCDLKPAR